MLNRRHFLSRTMMAGGALLVGPGITRTAGLFEAPQKLTILHTNDTHSRLDPFPMDGSRNQGLGGVSARSALVERIRKEEENVLLLDAGDIFQGTPYFNIYKGEPELRAMSRMGYDATTIGNHDFDAGIDNLAYQLGAHASFPALISNYDFTGTQMENRHRPYHVFKKGALQIGVFGLGIELEGLVPKALYGKTKYLDPIQKANETANKLKRRNCDLIVCLSHLGYKYTDHHISDLILARETEAIDVIIGGHTHTFLDAPVVVKNKRGEDVIINQVGFAGIQLGRMDFNFEKKERKNLVKSSSIPVTKKSEI